MKSSGSYAGWLLLSLPILGLVLLSLGGMLAGADWNVFLRHLQSQTTVDALGVSLRTSLLSLGLIFVFGTFFALGTARAPRALAPVLETLITLPALMPPSVAGLALLLAFGRFGFVGKFLDQQGISVAFTGLAVVMAQILVSAPFYVREAITAFRSTPPDLLDAARIDGATRYSGLRYVIMPLSSPFLITGLLLCWARAVGEFGATILFAGNLQGVTQTMPLAVYLGFESDLEVARTLGLVQIFFALLCLVLARVIFCRSSSFQY